MEAAEALTRYANMTPGKRCPDFNEDCALVKDHAHCAAGARRVEAEDAGCMASG